MRLLHTSDWHLGRTLHGFSLREEQERAVDAIVSLAVQHHVDAVLVAGDVFDRAVPPVEAMRLLDGALTRLDAAGVTVILTAGNHDSGDRLAMYGGLLREGVHLVGSMDQVGQPVVLADEHGPVLVYPLPYLDPDVARVSLAADAEPLARSHEAVITAAAERIEADLAGRGGPRAVVVGHAFVADAGDHPEELTSGSERDLTVGGVQVVPSRVFAGRGLDYVAMGHLHRPQVVRQHGPAIVYSGSLLRYSLSESGHEKSAVLVTIGAPGSEPVVERLPLAPSRGMTRLQGSLAELTGDRFQHRRDDYVELIVTDPEYPERMHARLDAVFPFALRKEHRPDGALVVVGADRGDARGRDPVDVMAGFLRKVTGRDASEVQRRILRETYESVRGDGA